MCEALKLSVYITVFCSCSLLLSGNDQFLKACSCPVDSNCTLIGSTVYCLQRKVYSRNNDKFPRTSLKAEDWNVTLIYVFFGIIMGILVLYFLVLLRPVQRLKGVCRRIKLGHNKRKSLEFEEIDLTFRDVKMAEKVADLENNEVLIKI